MSFDYTRIRRGEMIAAISAIVLFLVMFLKWYSFNGTIRTKFEILVRHDTLPITGTAWHVYSNTSLLLVALIVLALAMAVITATQQRVNFPLAAVTTGFGVLVLIVIIYKLFGHRPGGSKYSKVEIGGYLGLLATIAVTIGAFLTAREDGIAWRPAEGQPAGTEGVEPVGAGQPAGTDTAEPAGGAAPAGTETAEPAGARQPPGAGTVEPAGGSAVPGGDPSTIQDRPPRANE